MRLQFSVPEKALSQLAQRRASSKAAGAGIRGRHRSSFLHPLLERPQALWMRGWRHTGCAPPGERSQPSPVSLHRAVRWRCGGGGQKKNCWWLLQGGHSKRERESPGWGSRKWGTSSGAVLQCQGGTAVPLCRPGSGVEVGFIELLMHRCALFCCLLFTGRWLVQTLPLAVEADFLLGNQVLRYKAPRRVSGV